MEDPSVNTKLKPHFWVPYLFPAP